jgi:WD40 repeat protein
MPDIFAVALVRKDAFSDRVEHTLKGTPGMVAVWNMQSPIEPRLLLKAPEEILWVEFCPTSPSLIAGGCVNGQLIIWDIGKLLMAALSQKITSNNDTGNALFSESDRQVPVIQHVLSSSIEHSHGSAITQLMWVPQGLDLSKSGRPQATEGGKHECVQLMTLAADTTMLLWDLRPDKMKFSLANLKALDLLWRPLFKIFVAQGSADTADNGGVRFVTRPVPKSGVSGAKASDAEEDPLQTMVFVGTERGNLLYMDWRAKELDNGKLGVQELERTMLVHAGPVTALRRSPFIADLVLSVGGMGITVWKEGLWAGPILTASTSGQVRATAAEWSPTRPGVFFVGKADGTVDVWDLMDTTYAAALVVNVCSPVAVCQFEAQRCEVKVAHPYIAVGDDNGVVHVMEVPPGYATASANEADRLTTFVEAEVHRLDYVAKRMARREAKGNDTTTTDDATDAVGDDDVSPDIGPETAEEARLKEEVKDMLKQYKVQEREFLECVGLGNPEADEAGLDD